MKFNKLSAILFISFFIVACSNSDSNSSDKTNSRDVESSLTKEAKTNTKNKTIVFLGNSLAAGYGVDPEESFVGLTAQRIDSLGLPYKVINAGESGITTAGGASRMDWILRQSIDVFILELGGNDGLRGIKPEATYQNLQSIIDKTKAKYPDVKIIIAGMQAPPNMGSDFTDKFRAVFPKLAKENAAALIPFLLEGVGGIPTLNLADGIHPNPEGHKIVVENVWSVLEKIL